jgi:site-specific DNA-methyltransferase (adenine-specific)
MVLCDLPYGTTQNKWDSVIPLEPLWSHYRRIVKPSGVIVLTATQPFTTQLVSSNYQWFRYEWIWEKNIVTGHLNAHNRPMRNHESILVFSPKAKHTYNPQGLQPYQKIKTRGHNGTNFGKSGSANYQEHTNYPRTIVSFKSDSTKLHPTQKPLAMFEYLIRTYTNPGELVLDNCIGSGTTAIACLNTERFYIGFELDTLYFVRAMERINTHVT